MMRLQCRSPIAQADLRTRKRFKKLIAIASLVR
jgi:hypothetical protein